jgi:serine/threonine-protein kinase
MLGGVVAVALLVGAFAGWRWLTTASRGRATPPAAAANTRYLAVLPFRVLGTDERLRYVADGMVEALSAKLFRAEAIRVASVRDIEQAGSFRSVDDAARKLGANLIVEGTVQSAGNRLRLIVNLHDMATQRRTWSQEFTGAADDVFALEDHVFEELLGAIGVSGAQLRGGDVARRPDSLEAYDLYLRGRHALRSRDNTERIRGAIGFFERAVEQDPGFALAHTGLADASLLMYRETRDQLWAQRAQASAERARDLNDALPEVQYALGSVYAATGRHAESVVVLTKAIALTPNSDEAHRRLGAAYAALGREQEAMIALRRAVELNPYFWLNHNVLGGVLVQFGKADEAVEAFKRVTELEPDSPVGYENLGVTYFNQGRWEDCIPAFEKALSVQPHWTTYSNIGTAYFFLERYPDAVRAFERAVASNPNDAVSHGNLADALRWSGQADHASETYRRAIALSYKDLEVNPKDANTLGVLALYHAKSGDPSRARALIQQARAIDSQGVALIYYEAVVHALANRDDQALASLERALVAGYPSREVAADPELRRLGRTPAFQRLLRRFPAQKTP